MADVFMIRKPNGSWSESVCNRTRRFVKVALEHGINASLLRKWIGLYPDTGHSDPNRTLALPTFAPVVSVGAEQSIKPALNVRLPNGVKLELPSVTLSDLPLILYALAELPCSVSNRD